ncbi:MAG: prepilin peptidase [Candidatus Harrisonbacteria bacterium]|nr:prepilin peptidase [Candidatus Harrisonbacteria bacterium]
MFTALLLFSFGLVIGSFLNVVSFRYSEEKNLFHTEHLGGRSKCRHCEQKLAWYELVPVFSFLLQKGKCWVCYKKLSWQYLLMEVAGGLIFLLPLYLYNPIIPNSLFIIQSAIWILAFLTFLLIWSIDFRLYLIPDELNLVLGALGLVLADYTNLYGQFGNFKGSFLGSYAALFGWRSNIWINHFSAALIGGALVGLIIFLSKGKGMGMGDLKMMLALGLLYGWPDVLFIFIIASVIGAAASLALMLFHKKTLKDALPFGPFLVIGAILVFFWGEAILRSYFNFFGL